MTSTEMRSVVGRAGEEAAARYLERLGWAICARNWRPEGALHGLELDIVAKHEGVLVFVEVKTRRFASSALKDKGIPAHAAFSHEKKRRMTKAAMLYLNAEGLWNIPCRFDLICVQHIAEGEPYLEHHDNVIELGNLVDCGHSSWQPW